MKHKLTEIGLWFAQDLNRLRLVVFAATVLVSALALIGGLPDGVLVADPSGGSSGGTGGT